LRVGHIDRPFSNGHRRKGRRHKINTLYDVLISSVRISSENSALIHVTLQYQENPAFSRNLSLNRNTHTIADPDERPHIIFEGPSKSSQFNQPLSFAERSDFGCDQVFLIKH